MQEALQSALRSLYWTRFSFLFGFVLFVLPLVAWFWARSILFGLLVLENADGCCGAIWLKFVLMTWASGMSVLMIHATYQVTTLNAGVRFLGAHDDDAVGDPPSTPIWRLVLLIALSLWIPGWCAAATVSEYAKSEAKSKEPGAGPTNPQAVSLAQAQWQTAGGILAGGVVVLLTIAILGQLQASLFPASHTGAKLLLFDGPGHGNVEGQLATRLAFAFAFLNPGYTNQDGSLRPGHAQLGVMVGALLIIYFSIYRWLPIPSDGSPFSAIFFLLSILTLLGFILNGLSFFGDYYYVPTLLPLLLVVLATHGFLDVNHYFELNPPRDTLAGASGPAEGAGSAGERGAAGEQSAPSLNQILAKWKFPPGPSKSESAGRPGGTLVVVAAAGGGIQAAAWTAQVLTGLDEVFEDFTESVGLVSGVSGGSVGLMYYLQQKETRTNDPAKPHAISPPNRSKILEMAEGSGLEATAWGFAYPDLVRLFIPPLVHKRYDRGWALEYDWRRRLGSMAGPNDTRFSDWRSRIFDAKMAIPVFNSTIADTGASLILSPVVDTRFSNSQWQLLSEYAPLKPNPRITTAARLSATFSYISPICKPLPPGELASDDASALLHHHVADGGYVDNSGLLTATRWTEALLDAIDSKPPSDPPPFANVLFLIIDAFPQAEPDNRKSAAAERNGFLWEAIGPILTLNSARGASQTVRSDWELQLMKRAFHHEQRERMTAHLHEQLETLSSSLDQQEATGAKSLYVLANQPAAQVLDVGQAWIEQARSHVTDDAFPDAVVKGQVSDQLDKLATTIAKSRVNVYSIRLQPDRQPGDDEPPLSWKLTPSQKQDIRNAWGRIVKQIGGEQPAEPSSEKSLKPADLKRFFTCRQTQ